MTADRREATQALRKGFKVYAEKNTDKKVINKFLWDDDMIEKVHKIGVYIILPCFAFLCVAGVFLQNDIGIDITLPIVLFIALIFALVWYNIELSITRNYLFKTTTKTSSRKRSRKDKKLDKKKEKIEKMRAEIKNYET